MPKKRSLAAGRSSHHTHLKAFYIWLVIIVGLVIISYGLWVYYSQDIEHGVEVGGKTAVHMHPFVYVYTCGMERKLPLETGTAQFHTHKDRHRIHLGEGGPVENPETYFTLDKLFEAIGMKLTNNCLMEYCDSDKCPDGSIGVVKVTVNGVESELVEKTPMHDGDRIDVRFE